ncbi:hypothetical protein NFJ02_13g13030 [Pycnococcus provasolii]
MASSQAVVAHVAAKPEALGLKAGLLGGWWVYLRLTSPPAHQLNTSGCAAMRATTAGDGAMAPTSWQAHKPYHLPGGDNLSRQGATGQP